MNKKVIFIAILVILIGFGIYFYVSCARCANWYRGIRMPSTGMPIPSFSLCEVDSDCIHIIAVDESGSPYLEPITFQDCINKNYTEEEFQQRRGIMKEKTGKDLCECKQVDDIKMCAIKSE